MLFDHFLTPHPHPRGAASAGQTSSASEQRLRRDAYVADVGGGRIRFSCRRTGKTYSPYAAAAAAGAVMGTVPGTVMGTVLRMVVLVIKMPA